MVFQRATKVALGQSSIRELPLLEGERIEERFVPDDGLVPDTPLKGQLLVLTNKRVISFVQSDGQRESVLAPLEELRGVALKSNTRGFKDLSWGLTLVLAGIMGYLIVGYILENVLIAAGLGVAAAFTGVLFVTRYFFWEEEGSITFQGGSWELSFPYKNNRASADVYRLVDRFFQLKLRTNTHQPSLDGEEEANPPVPPFSASREGPSYDI